MSGGNDILRRPTGDETNDQNWFDAQDKIRQLRVRVVELENAPLAPASETEPGPTGFGSRAPSDAVRRDTRGVVSVRVIGGQEGDAVEARVPGARRGAVIIGMDTRGTGYVRIDRASQSVFVGFIPYPTALGGPPPAEPVRVRMAVVPL